MPNYDLATIIDDLSKNVTAKSENYRVLEGAFFTEFDVVSGTDNYGKDKIRADLGSRARAEFEALHYQFLTLFIVDHINSLNEQDPVKARINTNEIKLDVKPLMVRTREGIQRLFAESHKHYPSLKENMNFGLAMATFDALEKEYRQALEKSLSIGRA